MRREFEYQVGDTVHKVSVEQDGDQFVVRVGDHVLRMAARLSAPGRLDLEVEDRRLRAYVVTANGKQHVAFDGQTWLLQRPDARRRDHERGASDGALIAAMPGRVLDVLAVEGVRVDKGDTLVLLEAMKMELRVTAPAAGRVVTIHCQAGKVVARGQTLVEIAPE